MCSSVLKMRFQALDKCTSIWFRSSKKFMFLFSTLIPPFDDMYRHQYLDNHVLEQGSSSSSSSVGESHILNQLSEILPIRFKSSSLQKPLQITSRLKEESGGASTVDGFLQPEDKLRGIFLQKLAGKSALEEALTNVGVDLTVDVFANVVNRGSLSGDSMVMFFNWAVTQRNISTMDLDVYYHIILSALGRRKYIKHMMCMFLDMRKQGISAKSNTLFIVFDSFVQARKASKAIKMFHSLETYGLNTTTETFNALLRCLTKRSHVRLASSLLNKMKGKVRFDIISFNLIIGGWSKFGRVKEVEQILETMTDYGINPNSLTYSYILESLGRAGKIDGAVKIFENLVDDKPVLNADVYNAMISNYIALGDIDIAFEYYRLMLSSKCEPELDTYHRLISACLKARKVSDALELFDEMFVHKVVPTTGTVTSFIEPLCSYGPPHAALVIYKKAKEFGCVISLTAYKLLLKRLSRFGKCGMLLKVWDEMKISEYSSDIQVYEYIVYGLCNVGQLENAVLVMEEAMRIGFCPSRFICSKLNNKLMSSYKVETAYRLFLKIKVARRKENARRQWRAKGWHF